MIPYIENFYTQQEADELFEFIKTQPFVRPPNPRNKTYRLKRLSFPGYSPPVPPGRAARKFKPPSNYDVSRSVAEAPELYKKFAKRLSEFAGKEINYMSTMGYLTDDHMDFHQHEEDKKREDQTVWVLSLGAVHPVAVRPKGCKDKSQWEVIYPNHGSLYVLPSSHNLTHEHAVLYGNDCSYGGLRLAINTKHIPVPVPPPPPPKCDVEGCDRFVVPDLLVDSGGDRTKCCNHGGYGWGSGSGKTEPTPLVAPGGKLRQATQQAEAPQALTHVFRPASNETWCGLKDRAGRRLTGATNPTCQQCRDAKTAAPRPDCSLFRRVGRPTSEGGPLGRTKFRKLGNR